VGEIGAFPQYVKKMGDFLLDFFSDVCYWWVVGSKRMVSGERGERGWVKEGRYTGLKWIQGSRESTQWTTSPTTARAESDDGRIRSISMPKSMFSVWSKVIDKEDFNNNVFGTQVLTGFAISWNGKLLGRKLSGKKDFSDHIYMHQWELKPRKSVLSLSLKIAGPWTRFCPHGSESDSFALTGLAFTLPSLSSFSSITGMWVGHEVGISPGMVPKQLEWCTRFDD
jgi:hypothetical protein